MGLPARTRRSRVCARPTELKVAMQKSGGERVSHGVLFVPREKGKTSADGTSKGAGRLGTATHLEARNARTAVREEIPGVRRETLAVCPRGTTAFMAVTACMVRLRLMARGRVRLIVCHENQLVLAVGGTRGSGAFACLSISRTVALESGCPARLFGRAHRWVLDELSAKNLLHFSTTCFPYIKNVQRREISARHSLSRSSWFFRFFGSPRFRRAIETQVERRSRHSRPHKA